MVTVQFDDGPKGDRKVTLGPYLSVQMKGNGEMWVMDPSLAPLLIATCNGVQDKWGLCGDPGMTYWQNAIIVSDQA